MKDIKVRREIFFAITGCKDHNGRSLVQNTDAVEELAAAVFNTLHGEGLLKLDDDGD